MIFAIKQQGLRPLHQQEEDMRNKIFKFGRHTLSLIQLPSHKLFAIKFSKKAYGKLVEVHLGKVGGWYCYRPRA
jgi:hypothetical protein